MSWEGVEAERAGRGTTGRCFVHVQGRGRGCPRPQTRGAGRFLRLRTCVPLSQAKVDFSGAGWEGLEWEVPSASEPPCRSPPWGGCVLGPARAPRPSAPAEDPVSSWKAHLCLLLPAFLSAHPGQPALRCDKGQLAPRRGRRNAPRRPGDCSVSPPQLQISAVFGGGEAGWGPRLKLRGVGL